MNMKQTFTFLIILLISLKTFSQDKTFGVKIGYAISNAYAPNGTLLIYTNGSVGQDISSFEYKSGYQIGITKRLNLQEKNIYLTSQYSTYGFKDGNSTIDLNYIELGVSSIIEFGRKEKFYLGIGLGPAVLISHNNEADVSNKFDFRSNAFFGVEVLNNLNLFFEGKAGWIGLSKGSKIKSYMLSINTEILIF